MPISIIKDPSGGAAVDLSTLRAEHPDLVKRAEKVGISLSKRNLGGLRAQVRLYLDHSGSMRSDYRNGTVQKIVERALGFALQVDADGSIPVIAFDNALYPAVEVTVDNYKGVVDRDIWHNSSMSGTVMSAVFADLADAAATSDLPVIGIVIGDGSPNREDKAATTREACRTAGVAAWIKFLSVRPVDYLQELDDLEKKSPGARLLDNFDTKDVPNPDALTDLQFAEIMTDELDGWIREATAKGVLA